MKPTPDEQEADDILAFVKDMKRRAHKTDSVGIPVGRDDRDD